MASPGIAAQIKVTQTSKPLRDSTADAHIALLSSMHAIGVNDMYACNCIDNVQGYQIHHTRHPDHELQNISQSVTG